MLPEGRISRLDLNLNLTQRRNAAKQDANFLTECICYALDTNLFASLRLCVLKISKPDPKFTNLVSSVAKYFAPFA